jgi:hypothetical protein
MKDRAKPTTKEARAKLRAADKCVCGHRRDDHTAVLRQPRIYCWGAGDRCLCKGFRKARAPKPPPCPQAKKRALARFSSTEELPSSLLAGSPVAATRLTLVGEIKDALLEYTRALLDTDLFDRARLEVTEPKLRKAEAALAELLATALTRAR